MTLVLIKGKKRNICLHCGNFIVNRYKNATYCKKCSNEIRKENCRKAMEKYNKINGVGKKYGKGRKK